MRVLHLVATGQRRGAEVFAADLVGELHRAGVEQEVAVLHGEPSLPYAAPVTPLRADGWRLPGLRVDPRAVWRLRALTRARKPQLIQAHGGEPLKYALAAVGGTVPVVYRRIGSAAGWLPRGPRRVVHARLARRAARVVAVAEAVREETIAALRIPPERVVTIPNGVDPARLVPRRPRDELRRALGVPADAAVVLSLGALTWEKDPLEHLAVTAPLLRAIPTAAHLFAGDGPLRADLEEAIAREGLDGRVRLLGSRADVGDLLAASDLLLFVSRTEGMPAAVIEAGIGGLPVAGVAVAGVPEVVEHEATGLLVAPGDREGLRAAVARLAGDAELRARLGGRARRRCLERFGITPVAAAYQRLYQEVLGVSAGRGALWAAS